MSPNVPKIGPRLVYMDGFAKNGKIAHYMVLFWAFSGQILVILRISDQKNN